MDKKYDHLHVLAFINGFDVGVIQYGESLTDFEVSVDILDKHEDSF